VGPPTAKGGCSCTAPSAEPWSAWPQGPGDGNRRRINRLKDKRPILQAIVDMGPEASRKLYADSTGYCMFCDALLTDEISEFFGYGPECAKNHDRPYGIKAARAAGMPELQKTS
jgi:hypothetical protein